DVAGDELRVRVRDRDDRLAEVAALHAGGAPEGAGACHVAAVGRGAGTELSHARHATPPCEMAVSPSGHRTGITLVTAQTISPTLETGLPILPAYSSEEAWSPRSTICRVLRSWRRFRQEWAKEPARRSTSPARPRARPG